MTAADQRVTYAREYLAGCRQRKLAELPPSALLREAAELRRELGQILDVVDAQAAELAALAEIREVLAEVLDDELADRQSALEQIERLAGEA
jgi:hypothetical protein